MSKKRFSLRAILITVLITFLLTGGLGILAARRLLGSGGLAMLQSVRLIESRFVGEYDKERTVDTALAAMVDSLGDRWSVYLNPEQHAAYEAAMKNAYVGIGIRYQRREQPCGMEIVDVVAGGPAEEMGLTVGEIITAVDGETLTEENFEAVVSRIGDLKGKETTLTVLSPDGSSREVKVAVRQVEDPPAEYAMLDRNVGYVRLENFYQNSAQAVEDAVEDLIAQGAEGLIFDVRGNPGGYVSELTRLLDYLLPEGAVFIERSKGGRENVFESDAACVDLPMVVLVDGDSYSAAELFAAQLRESVNAPLVGEKTFGKGYYQQGFTLANGGELHISTGLYTTGGGVSLIGTGLTPDYVVEDDQAQEDKAFEVICAALP